VHEYVLTLLVTAAVTYLLTPLVRRGAVAVRAVAVPRERDVHTSPVPLLGGLAMYGGLAAGLAVADRLPSLQTVFQGDSRMAAGLLLAGGLIVIVGVVDDRWGMGPISKAAGQAVAGGILVWGGAQLSWLPEPGNGTLILTPNQSTALTIFLVVATINAVNFIDGLDGLAAGIVCIAAIAFFVYYYRLTQVYHLPEQAVPALASAVLAGACLGFLPHNFFPAKIFMGDTGAMLLGLLLAYVPISSIASLDYASLTPHDAVNRFPEILPLLLPAAFLAIPYTDLLLAVVRRARAGLSPMAADQKHLHHRLLEIGHSHRSSVLIMYLWAGLFASAITWLSISRVKLVVLAVTTLGAMLALLLMSMPRLRPWRRRAARPAAARPATARLAAHSFPPSPVQPAAATLTAARSGLPGPAVLPGGPVPGVPPGSPGPAVLPGSTVIGTVPSAPRYEANGSYGYVSAASDGYAPAGTGRFAPEGTAHLAPDGAARYAPDGTAGFAPDGAARYAPDGTGGFAPDGAGRYAPDGTARYAPDGTAGFAPDGAGPFEPDDTGPLEPDGTEHFPPEGSAPLPPISGPHHAPSGVPLRWR
jgi:UDP-GlcNAc:undecaprenyl-phosphate GlcNAc-1-phosphate transferase